ncbi:MAG: ATP synthase F1 subunit gamma [Candidatus Absconditabacteria bacterium]|nr:ATP synthase F1 subunit gamma [Candidatus Absconditabacteria bacterium]MDD3868763.1 ATP synthase F1 subunit gamma [Candidatus Absconditabacteria bacterium]MDD4713855.1 ATP synthase F1 subunit gamma [Candidatus Absconditabacteria bacterium]
MVTTKYLRSKIKTTKSLQKIISALEFSSTSKLQRLKNQTLYFKEFFYEFLYVVEYVQKQIDIFDTSFQEVATSKKRLLVVITSDKGLCGGLNTNILKRVVHSYGTRKEMVDIIAIGKKGKEFFQRNGRNVVASLSLRDKVSSGELVELYEYLRKALDQKQYSRVKVYFNFFKNTLLQVPVRFHLFPMNQETLDEFVKEVEMKSPLNRRRYHELMIEPDVETYKQHMVQNILENMIYYTVLNAKTSEHAARMLAMKSSKDNCVELEAQLRRAYNKTRQGKITQEISEIVGTKLALEGK